MSIDSNQTKQIYQICPDLTIRSGPPKGRHSTLHVGRISIPRVPDVGRNSVAMWVSTGNVTHLQALYPYHMPDSLCISFRAT